MVVIIPTISLLKPSMAMTCVTPYFSLRSCNLSPKNEQCMGEGSDGNVLCVFFPVAQPLPYTYLAYVGSHVFLMP